MVVQLVQENQSFPLFARGTFYECLRIACTKQIAAELMNVSGLKEQKIEKLLHHLVFEVLEVKDGLDRTS